MGRVSPSPRVAQIAARRVVLRPTHAHDAAAPHGERPFAPFRATTSAWRSVRRRHTPYPTPATTPCAPLIATTRLCARGTPPSSRLSPPCAPRREPLQRRCSARRAAVAKLTMITRITSYSAYSYLFLDFHGRFAVLSTKFPRTFHRRSKNRYSLRNTYALRGVLGRWYGDIPLNLARYSRDLPCTRKTPNLFRASLSLYIYR